MNPLEQLIPVTKHDISGLLPHEVEFPVTKPDINKIRDWVADVRIREAMHQGGGSQLLIDPKDIPRIPAHLKNEILLKDPLNAIRGLLNTLKQFDASYNNQTPFLETPDAQLHIKRIEAIYNVIQSDPDLKTEVLGEADFLYSRFFAEMEQWLQNKKYTNNELHGIRKIVTRFYVALCRDYTKYMSEFIRSYSSQDINNVLQ